MKEKKVDKELTEIKSSLREKYLEFEVNFIIKIVKG